MENEYYQRIAARTFIGTMEKLSEDLVKGLVTVDPSSIEESGSILKVASEDSEYYERIAGQAFFGRFMEKLSSDYSEEFDEEENDSISPTETSKLQKKNA